jgi:regulator of RNase E activity RraA
LRLFVDGDRLGVLDHDGTVLLSDEEAADAAAEEAARADRESRRAEKLEAELRELKARYGLTDT